MLLKEGEWEAREVIRTIESNKKCGAVMLFEIRNKRAHNSPWRHVGEGKQEKAGTQGRSWGKGWIVCRQRSAWGVGGRRRYK